MKSVRVTVHVHPRASRARRAWDGRLLELWIHEPPVDGAANTAVVDDVARWLGVPRRLVRLVSGATARTKVVEVEGLVSLPPPDEPA
jgi:uncharacterized protein YggU (UPF0235/DUF167 family)